MTTNTPTPDNLRICINELYEIVAELPAGDNAARLNSVIAMLQAKTDEQMELVEALKWALEHVEYAPKPKLIHTPEDTARKIRSILAKIGAL